MKNFLLFTILGTALAFVETFWVTMMISELVGHPLNPLWLLVVWTVLNWTWAYDFKFRDGFILIYRFNQLCWVCILQSSIWIYHWIK